MTVVPPGMVPAGLKETRYSDKPDPAADFCGQMFSKCKKCDKRWPIPMEIHLCPTCGTANCLYIRWRINSGGGKWADWNALHSERSES